MEPVALSALALVALVGFVAIVLAILNRHSMRWRLGVFYEREDGLPQPEKRVESPGHQQGSQDDDDT